tara:strand:+ start:589 stop:807 length:219 start_codon:yes stop_codon:yes gene_type:complete
MSKFLSLNSIDFVKGLVVSVFSAVITVIYTSLQTGSLSFDWKSIGITALTTALAYLMKNFITNSEGKLLKAS